MIDLHMHTTYSDGKNSILEMARAAKEIGLTQIAITDHVWISSDWFDAYCEEIKSVNIHDCAISIGFEAKAINCYGEIDASPNAVCRSVTRIGSIHRLPKKGQTNIFYSSDEILAHKEYAYDDWLITTKSLINNNAVTILGHPFSIPAKFKLPIMEKDILEICSLVFSSGKKMEVSGRYRMSNEFIFTIMNRFPHFVSMLVFGSDAHSVTELYQYNRPFDTISV